MSVDLCGLDVLIILRTGNGVARVQLHCHPCFFTVVFFIVIVIITFIVFIVITIVADIILIVLVFAIAIVLIHVITISSFYSRTAFRTYHPF